MRKIGNDGTETPSIQPTDQQNIKPIYLKTIKVLKLHFEN